MDLKGSKSAKADSIDNLAKYRWIENDKGTGVEMDIPDFRINGTGCPHNIELLVLNESKKKRDYDALLRIGCAFDEREGYMNHYITRFRDGKFVSGWYGSGYSALLGRGNGISGRFCSAQGFLQDIAENLCLPTERFLAYFAHPSLDAGMRQHIKELLEVKERYAPKSKPKHEEPALFQLMDLLMNWK